MQTKILAFAVTGAIALMGTTGSLAQEATPTGESLFAGLGLPELTVTATDEGFELSESEVAAGRYLVTVVNESANPEAAAGFVRLTEGNSRGPLGRR